MKREMLFELIGELDETLLDEETEQVHEVHPGRSWIGAAMAACLVLGFGAGLLFLLPKLPVQDAPPAAMEETTESPKVMTGTFVRYELVPAGADAFALPGSECFVPYIELNEYTGQFRIQLEETVQPFVGTYVLDGYEITASVPDGGPVFEIVHQGGIHILTLMDGSDNDLYEYCNFSAYLALEQPFAEVSIVSGEVHRDSDDDTFADLLTETELAELNEILQGLTLHQEDTPDPYGYLGEIYDTGNKFYFVMKEADGTETELRINHTISIGGISYIVSPGDESRLRLFQDSVLNRVTKSVITEQEDMRYPFAALQDTDVAAMHVFVDDGASVTLTQAQLTEMLMRLQEIEITAADCDMPETAGGRLMIQLDMADGTQREIYLYTTPGLLLLDGAVYAINQDSGFAVSSCVSDFLRGETAEAADSEDTLEYLGVGLHYRLDPSSCAEYADTAEAALPLLTLQEPGAGNPAAFTLSLDDSGKQLSGTYLSHDLDIAATFDGGPSLRLKRSAADPYLLTVTAYGEHPELVGAVFSARLDSWKPFADLKTAEIAAIEILPAGDGKEPVSLSPEEIGTAVPLLREIVVIQRDSSGRAYDTGDTFRIVKTDGSVVEAIPASTVMQLDGKRYCIAYDPTDAIQQFLESLSAENALHTPKSEAAAKYTIQDASQAIAFYENAMNQPEWQNSADRTERGEMVQLPDALLQNMSTDALIEAVLEYPFFIDVYCFNDTQTGMDIMYDTFNGLRELAARTDAAQALLQKYESEPVLMTASADADTFRLTSMEILLAQDYIAEKLTAEEAARLYDLCAEKYAQKQESELYGGFNTVFFDLTGTEVPEE